MSEHTTAQEWQDQRDKVFHDARVQSIDVHQGGSGSYGHDRSGNIVDDTFSWEYIVDQAR